MVDELKGLRRSLAKRLVRDCLGITRDDTVTILTGRHAIDLAEEISLEAFGAGADVLLNLYTDRYFKGYLKLLPTESLREPSRFCTALVEASTVEIFLSHYEDPAILHEIPPEKLTAMDEGELSAHYPRSLEKGIREAVLGVSAVTPARARAYGLDHGTWGRMMYQASTVDYRQLAMKGRRLVEALEGAKQVRITAPGGTDLTLTLEKPSVHLNDGIIDAGDRASANLAISIPAGEVTVVPARKGAHGHVAFDLPMLHSGRVHRGVEWTFSSGRVTKFAGQGKRGKKLLAEYQGAPGDKDRIAYLSIGFNPRARLGFTVDNLAKGALTIGIGNNDSLGGANRTPYYAAGTLSRATVALDGSTLVKDGHLVL